MVIYGPSVKDIPGQCGLYLYSQVALATQTEKGVCLLYGAAGWNRAEKGIISCYCES